MKPWFHSNIVLLYSGVYAIYFVRKSPIWWDEEDIDFIPVPEPDPNDNHEIIYELPSREKCFAHTLSLIATSDLKKITTFPAEYKRVAGPSGTAISKLSELWNMTSRPRTSEIIVNGFGRSIERPCLTRWNSLYDCLNSLLSYSKDKINGVIFMFFAANVNKKVFTIFN